MDMRGADRIDLDVANVVGSIPATLVAIVERPGEPAGFALVTRPSVIFVARSRE
jgi:hypothetical protein